MKRLALAIALTLIPSAVLSAPQVDLSSHISLVRTVVDSKGKATTSYVEPKLVTPGDRLQITLEYSNGTGKAADNFVVTDPLPQGVVFAGNESPGAQVSVDGGKTFGPLASLQVTGAAGSRSAIAADVTHVRWSFARPIAAGEHGQLHFDAVVK